MFFDHNWVEIGTKYTFMELISEITGIEEHFSFMGAGVAQKISWAASRQTTGEEDRGYCLIRLFGVNLLPIYGEGDKAFVRLQLEILAISDNESIFAWADDEDFSGTSRSVSGSIYKVRRRGANSIRQS